MAKQRLTEAQGQATDEVASMGDAAVQTVEQPEVSAEQRERAEQQAEYSRKVQEYCLMLKPGFGSGKDFKDAGMYRRIVNSIFQNAIGHLDLGQVDKNVDAVFTAATADMAKRAEEIGEEVGAEITALLTAIGVASTRAVTLKNQVMPIDMCKAYVNWRPAAKLVNTTFFNAV